MHDIIEVEITFLHETEKAILVRGGPHENQIWIPKAQVELLDPDALYGTVTTIEMPEQLAIDKGLI